MEYYAAIRSHNFENYSVKMVLMEEILHNINERRHFTVERMWTLVYLGSNLSLDAL